MSNKVGRPSGGGGGGGGGEVTVVHLVGHDFVVAVAVAEK